MRASAVADDRDGTRHFGDTPVSAEFYTGGRTQRAADASQLNALHADPHLDFVARGATDAARLPGDQRAHVAAGGRIGEFDLYRAVPAPR